MRSMRGGFIFRSQGPWLKVHHGQCLTSVTKHDAGGSPPGANRNVATPLHGHSHGHGVFSSNLFARGHLVTVMVNRAVQGPTAFDRPHARSADEARYQYLSSWVCRGAGCLGVLEPVGGRRAFDTSVFVGSALGCWVKEGWDWLFIILQEMLLK